MSGYALSVPEGSAAYGGMLDWCIHELNIPAFTFECGKGKMVIIATNVGAYFNRRKTVTARQIGEKLLDMYTPVAHVKNTRLTDINVATKDGKTYINLVNAAGPHGENAQGNFDEIPALYNIEVELNLDKTPSKITLQPDGKTLTLSGNTVTVPKLEIHNCLEIEY